MNTASYSVIMLQMVIMVVNLLVLLGFSVLGLYALFLFIQLLRRGIKVVDIYLDRNEELEDTKVVLEEEQVEEQVLKGQEKI